MFRSNITVGSLTFEKEIIFKIIDPLWHNSKKTINKGKIYNWEFIDKKKLNIKQSSQ